MWICPLTKRSFTSEAYEFSERATRATLLPDEELEDHHRRYGERNHDGDEVGGGFLKSVGDELGKRLSSKEPSKYALREPGSCWH